MTSTDFAAAQQRIAARRQLRASEVQARLASQRDHHASNALSRLPFPFYALGGKGLEAWDTIRGREGTRPAFRVGQVDAELLDEELLELLKGQVGDALKCFGSHLRDEWSPEILLCLRAILFKLTIWDHNASYGAALVNLRYTDARHKGPVLAVPTRWQKVLYGFFTVGGRYAWNKWEDWLVDQEGGYEEPSSTTQTLSRISSIISTTHSTAAFASFLVFLYNGRYRTLLDRILRLRLASPSSQISREVSFEYLNRQLVWHAFTEFLLFLLPLVGVSRWRRWLTRAWRRTKAFFKNAGDEEDDGMKMGGELAYLPERTCALCYQDQNPTATSENEIMAVTGASGGIIGSAQTDVTNPYETIPCGCIYCFVCLASRLEAEDGEGWTCLRCGELVKECRPWNGDVLEDVAKHGNGSGKTVSFSDEEEKGQVAKEQHFLTEKKGLSAAGDRGAGEQIDESFGEKAPESEEWAEVEAAGTEEAHSP
ncbi:peroxisomal biogenesis factor 2 [Lasallia pustulata]|uniref:Peroxisomal biogenesis factor 2 n=1 Tax=Lasallia pustulata TaxID=136370 RepID=A0A1W5CWU2_9LECA|nr:peroxisomal biogenesis factor 2 [Lasallia pustulata]